MPKEVIGFHKLSNGDIDMPLGFILATWGGCHMLLLTHNLIEKKNTNHRYEILNKAFCSDEQYWLTESLVQKPVKDDQFI